jgi:hypothetical protein
MTDAWNGVDCLIHQACDEDSDVGSINRGTNHKILNGEDDIYRCRRGAPFDPTCAC